MVMGVGLGGGSDGVVTVVVERVVEAMNGDDVSEASITPLDVIFSNIIFVYAQKRTLATATPTLYWHRLKLNFGNPY